MFRLDSTPYPGIGVPRSQGELALDELHTMYWEETGNPDGEPVLILHGGPGSSIQPHHRNLIDPAFYRGIHFDQRGCGRSTPAGELRRNDTATLVADIEALRRHKRIERWILMGGSWGSSLALAYAQAHPERVRALLLTGVTFLCTVARAWWWEGVRHVFPDVWEEMARFVPPSERDDLASAYHARVLHDDPAVHAPAAIALMIYEAQTLHLWPNRALIDAMRTDPATIASGRIFCHYDRNAFFLEDRQLLHAAPRLAGIPGAIVGGRYDMCTPVRFAWELHRAWPGSSLEIVPAAGHTWGDPLLAAAVARMTDAWRDRLRSGDPAFGGT